MLTAGWAIPGGKPQTGAHDAHCLSGQSHFARAEASGGPAVVGRRGDNMSDDSTLEGLWKTAREGRLSPLEQLRAVAFRDVYKECGVPKDKQGRQPALLNAIARKIKKAGGGHP